jgi:hypothetical protein
MMSRYLSLPHHIARCPLPFGGSFSEKLTAGPLTLLVEQCYFVEVVFPFAIAMNTLP